jgi:hypothetical protein
MRHFVSYARTRLGTMLTFAALGLAACGGGGGSGGTVGGGSTTPLTLTRDNYVAAAQEALSASLFVAESPNFTIAAELSDRNQALRMAVQQARHAASWFGRQGQVATGVTRTETQLCDGRGSMQITVNDANGNSRPDPGDTARAVITDCAIDGEVANGVISMTFNAQSGDPLGTVYTLDLSMVMENLAVTSSAGTVTANGRLDLAIASTGLNNVSVTIVARSLESTAVYGASRSTRTQTDFTVRTVVQPAGSSFTVALSIDGSITSSGLESHSLRVSTVSPLVSTGTALFPGSGQIVVSGAGSGKVRATAQNASNVLIELDADGDGTYEASSVRGWSTLI